MGLPQRNLRISYIEESAGACVADDAAVVRFGSRLAGRSEIVITAGQRLYLRHTWKFTLVTLVFAEEAVCILFQGIAREPATRHILLFFLFTGLLCYRYNIAMLVEVFASVDGIMYTWLSIKD